MRDCGKQCDALETLTLTSVYASSWVTRDFSIHTSPIAAASGRTCGASAIGPYADTIRALHVCSQGLVQLGGNMNTVFATGSHGKTRSSPAPNWVLRTAIAPAILAGN